MSKLKAFADDKMNVTEKFKFVLERVENIVIYWTIDNDKKKIIS